MLSKKEVLEWLESVEDENGVAIDETGLNIVEVDEDGEETGNYLELGLTPAEEHLLNPDEDEEDEEEEEDFEGFQTED